MPSGDAMNATAARGVDASPSDGEWQGFWRGHSVASEIAMADFYGLRHVLLKYLPRHGTVVEAGCGLGRYVFYLRALGMRAVGCERLLPALQMAQRWASAYPEDRGAFSAADVRQMPVRDASLSGYISLGVIEHFPEGPSGAINEAFRVLHPGGVAIFEVPSARAFDGYLHQIKRGLGTLIGRRRGPAVATMHEEPLAPRALGALVRAAGFTLLFCAGVDLIYPAWSLGIGPRWYGPLQRSERTALAEWGGLAVAVGMKSGTGIRCFVCGVLIRHAAANSVAFCDACRSRLPEDVGEAYSPAHINDVQWQSLDRTGIESAGRCSQCGGEVVRDRRFGDWGFSLPVCATCVRQPLVNLVLAHRAIKRVWRPRTTEAA